MGVLRAVTADLFAWVYRDEPIQVVALPGWMRTVSDFRSVLDDLPAMALDFPGFGGVNEPPPTAWSTFDYACSILPALEELPGPAVFLGHSFGGRVALQIAASRPDLVRAVVLTGVPQLCARQPTKPSAQLRAVRLLRKAGLLSERRLEEWKKRHGSEDYRRAAGVMRDILVKAVNENYEDQLRGLKVPTEFIWGDADSMVPVSEATRAIRLVPEGLGSLTVLEGVGHLTPLESPLTLRAAVSRLCTA